MSLMELNRTRAIANKVPQQLSILFLGKLSERGGKGDGSVYEREERKRERCERNNS